MGFMIYGTLWLVNQVLRWWRTKIDETVINDFAIRQFYK